MDLVRSNNGPRYKHLADEPAPYDTITVDKLTPIIGGEIGGVDLSRPLGNRTLDEIHRIPKTVEEYLYSAMEDFRLDIMIDQGPNARSVRLPLPRPLPRGDRASRASG